MLANGEEVWCSSLSTIPDAKRPNDPRIFSIGRATGGKETGREAKSGKQKAVEESNSCLINNSKLPYEKGFFRTSHRM